MIVNIKDLRKSIAISNRMILNDINQEGLVKYHSKKYI